MLPHQHRLRNRHIIESVYRRGRICRGRHLLLRYCPVEAQFLDSELVLPTTQIAVVVGKKVSRKAVQRNRVKRRLRHQLSTFIGSLGAGYAVILTARVPKHLVSTAKQCSILTASSIALSRELSHLLNEAGLLVCDLRSPDMP